MRRMCHVVAVSVLLFSVPVFSRGAAGADRAYFAEQEKSLVRARAAAHLAPYFVDLGARLIAPGLDKPVYLGDDPALVYLSRLLVHTTSDQLLARADNDAVRMVAEVLAPPEAGELVLAQLPNVHLLAAPYSLDGAGGIVRLWTETGVRAADEDLNSTPTEQPLTPEEKAAARAAAMAPAPAGPAYPSVVTVGLNFQSSQLGIDSGFIPPDTMGAVGPRHIVELINGNFEAFDKETGVSLRSRSLDGFWTIDVGLTIPDFNDVCPAGGGFCSVSGNPCADSGDCVRNFTYDPRIVYDPASGRWFASSLDATNPATGDNNIYVARSDTDDPLGDWDGFLFDADTVGPPEFHDYDTLAVDADALYICTQDFDSGSGGGGVESCYSIPKADLLLATPSAANMTRFESSPAGLPGVSGSVQPVLDFGSSNGRAALMGVSGGSLVRSDIVGADAAGATLGTPTGITGDPGHAAPPDARQPHPTGRTIENVAPRFVSNLVKQGGSVWAVHAVAGNFGNSALRWYEIDEATNTVLQTGLIEDKDQDFHEPSIAVNEFGNVMIGYTCSGERLAPSSCVSIGRTDGGVTTFEAPIVLRVGDGHYYRDYPPGRNRWGDYSATVVDPVNPCKFWTFQEFVAVSAVGDVGPGNNGGEWGIQITELTCSPPVISVPGNLPFETTCVGDTGTATLEVCNTTPNAGPCANLVVTAITSSDAHFSVTEPSSGFPVVISPDFCFPFQVQFTPTAVGPQSAILTIESNDPEDPVIQVTVTGDVPPGDIRVTGSTDFGDVCPEALAEKTISICNVGKCDLAVFSAAFDPPCADFTLINNPFPATVSPDSCLDLVIRLTPTSVGPKSCTLVITSDDPDTPTVSLTVTANVIGASIDVPPDLAFPPTVIQEVGPCLSLLPFPISNTGTCDLTITDISISGPDASAYWLVGLPSFPIILEPGHVVGEGGLAVAFAPAVLDRDLVATLTVTYVSDPVTGGITSVTRTLCGEGVFTGARVLVTIAGVPAATVKRIHIKRVAGNSNRNRVDTVGVSKNLPLVSVTPAVSCTPFQYHQEYGTVANPTQFLPGSYLVTATAIVNGKRRHKTVAFGVDTCTFNPTVVVNF